MKYKRNAKTVEEVKKTHLSGLDMMNAGDGITATALVPTTFQSI